MTQQPFDVDHKDPDALRVLADWHEEKGEYGAAQWCRSKADSVAKLNSYKLEPGEWVRFRCSNMGLLDGIIGTIGDDHVYIARTDRPSDKRGRYVFVDWLTHKRELWVDKSRPMVQWVKLGD